MKKIIYAFILVIPLEALAGKFEFEITSRWSNKKTKNVLSTVVMAHAGENWQIPLESAPSKYLKMSASEEGRKIILNAQIIDKKDGKEMIQSQTKIETEIGKKAQIINRSTDGNETLEVEIIPNKVSENIKEI